MKKRGRPSKYKSEYCQLLLDHMANGFTYNSFAALIPDNSVNMDTIYEWEKKHPDFAETKKRGIILATYHWEKISAAIASGRKITIRTKEGVQVINPKDVNTAVHIFNLKNRLGWRDKHDVDLKDYRKTIELKYKVNNEDKKNAD